MNENGTAEPERFAVQIRGRGFPIQFKSVSECLYAKGPKSPFSKGVKGLADDDIYGSKKSYERTVSNIHEFSLPVNKRTVPQRGIRRYQCTIPANMQYWQVLFDHFEARDLSYIRRLRLINSFKLIIHHAHTDLRSVDAASDRQAIDGIVREARKTLNPSSTSCLVTDLKFVWKVLFPAKDVQGRPDEHETPYCVRHLSTKIDRSRQKMRNDRLEVNEFLRIVDSFSDDPRLQAYITLGYESLGRPQELLSRRIKDVKLHDNYAVVYISEHGKEGVGILQSIESYPYLTKWLDQHPQRADQEAFLFPTIGAGSKYGPLRPEGVNKSLRQRCAVLGIKKKITCYSLKRNGVSDLRLRGESDKQIQARARWTTTRQLNVYDITSQEEALKAQLIKKGIIPPDKEHAILAPVTKHCTYCNAINSVTSKTCVKCTRLLYREDVEAEQKKQQEQASQATLALNQRLENMEKLVDTTLKELNALRLEKRLKKHDSRNNEIEVEYWISRSKGMTDKQASERVKKIFA